MRKVLTRNTNLEWISFAAKLAPPVTNSYSPDSQDIAPGITGYFYGNTPVQGEGKIDGYTWHFRARHDQWSLMIASSKEDSIEDLITFKNDPFVFHSPFYNAGWMTYEDARDLFLIVAEEWRATKKE